MSTNRAALAPRCESEYSHRSSDMRASAHHRSKSLKLNCASGALGKQPRSFAGRRLWHGSPVHATYRSGETTFVHPSSRSPRWHEPLVWPPWSWSWSALAAARKSSNPNVQRRSESETVFSGPPDFPEPPACGERSGYKTPQRLRMLDSTRLPANPSVARRIQAQPFRSLQQPSFARCLTGCSPLIFALPTIPSSSVGRAGDC